MNRICIIKSTNSIIEFQSGIGKPGTLLENAINAKTETGVPVYDPGDLEELETPLSVSEALLAYESPENKSKREDREAEIIQMKQNIQDGLPSLQECLDEIDASAGFNDFKAIYKKHFKIIYALAKGSIE